MTHNVLDTIVLLRDIPDHGVFHGDLGVVVEIYDDDTCEVEFVRASGSAQAVLELSASDIRALREDDMMAVRELRETA
jgi:hypothetical protein